MMGQQSLSVSQLNEIIKAVIDSEEVLQDLWVFGEISNYKIYRSGHHYFTLKDQDASIRCVMYKYAASRMKFRPEDGMQCAVFGKVSLYKADGGIQLVCTSIRPLGMGDLHFAFEQLKSRLYAEGLFNSEHKQALPPFPRRIAVITSGDGAAVHDILRITGARWPMSEIKVVPVHVQGELAAPEICDAIDNVNRYDAADVIIAGRGGGSLEDLWAFNEESVARAIYRSHIPVISAVGHEPDVTISDFVADVRASTPSNAAELCVPNSDEVRQGLDALAMKLESMFHDKLNTLQKDLNDLSSRAVLKDPEGYLSLMELKLEKWQSALLAGYERRMKGAELSLSSAAASLDAMSPLKVLGRGYAYAAVEGHPVRSAKCLHSGDRITVTMQDGSASCSVISTSILGE